jgi:hypothetical protein
MFLSFLRGGRWGFLWVLPIVCALAAPVFAETPSFPALCRTGTADEVRRALLEGADPNCCAEKWPTCCSAGAVFRF